jgi:hypothetical protein
MVQRNSADGRLQFTTDLVVAVHHGALQFRGVGMPPDECATASARTFSSPAPATADRAFPRMSRRWSATATRPRYGRIDLRALTAVEAANDSQKRVLVYKVVAGFGEDLQGRSFALWGLAFKPDTDEMREAPSRVSCTNCCAAARRSGRTTPVAMDEARRVFGDLPGLIFDGRNFFDPALVRSLGLEYHAIGRGEVPREVGAGSAG